MRIEIGTLITIDRDKALDFKSLIVNLSKGDT